MTESNAALLVAVLFSLTRCAHTELTGDEHRKAAAVEIAAAERSTSYEPSDANLAEADRKMASAFKHLNAARQLENFQDDACWGISDPERTSCPLLAPHLDRVEERADGVVLHFKSAPTTRTIATQMRCHLAFAMANNFERIPCPLYLKGVAITVVGEQAIAVTSADPSVARTLREEARRMFGEPPSTATAR